MLSVIKCLFFSRMERKGKPGKISVEIFKEGVVSYMVGDPLEGPQVWQKFKLVLGKFNIMSKVKCSRFKLRV